MLKQAGRPPLRQGSEMLKQAGRPPLRQGSEMLKQARRLVPNKIEEADGFFVVELGQAGHDGFLLRLEHTCPCAREERALNFGRNSGLLQSRRPNGLIAAAR